MEITAQMVERAPGAHRRRHDGLQDGPRRRPLATSRTRSTCCARRASPRPPRRPDASPRRRGRLLHPRRRQDRRAGRGQLRDRLRGAHRRLPGAGARHRHAHRGRRPAVRAPRRGHARGPRAREGDLPRAGARLGQARERGRQDRRRQDREVLRRVGAARAAVRQGPRDRRSASWSPSSVAKIGENIQIRRFVRFKLGEGIEKADDFAAEVAGRRPSDRDLPATRILLKLSGEALMGSQPFGIDEAVVVGSPNEVARSTSSAVQVAIVIGGGNIIRGVAASHRGIDRVTGDYMGMLGDGDQRARAPGRAGEGAPSTPGSRPRSTSARWPSRSSGGAPSVISRRGAW